MGCVCLLLSDACIYNKLTAVHPPPLIIEGSIFLREIFEFDATTLAVSHVKAVKKIFAKRPDEFVPEVIAKKGSLALVPLFKWVTSMLKFFDQTQG